jgi:hypothetical protein
MHRARSCSRLPITARDRWPSRLPIVLALTLAIVGTSAGRGAAAATPSSHDRRARAAATTTDAGGPLPCDNLDPKQCLFPFPNDYFTVRDPSTATGRRVNFSAEAMPKNVAGIPIDPTDWNRNDGFSPGSAILTFVPGLDLERTGAAPQTDLGRSLRPDAPIVLLDTVTHRRVPYWAELDQRTPADQQSLIVRPAINFAEGHHIIVALRNLKDQTGTTIGAGPGFRTYRDHVVTDDPIVIHRRPHFDELFTTLGHAGVTRRDLYLAWDFTVASQRSLSERMLHIRDDAFASLGVRAPTFQVTQVANNVNAQIARKVTGTFTVPNYLTGDGSAGNRFHFGTNGLPQRNGSLSASFICIIPSTALRSDGSVRAGRPSLFGHGLLGNNNEVLAGNVEMMANEHDFVYCATKWIGMSDEDLGNAAAILTDLGRFPTLVDRVQQGFLNTLFLGRLMKAANGFVTNAAFQGSGGQPVIDRRDLFYDGNSQGGIFGGAVTAVAVDWQRAVLGVPAMNFSTLLFRSSDFATYEQIFDPAYTNPMTRPLAIGIVQMLWDRGEANGYAQHLTERPYPGTPRHTVLVHEAFGDFQVANVATEVEARTIGARAYRPALTPGRSPDRQPLWGIPTIAGFPYRGSALVVWDSGTPAAPTGDVAPHAGSDPHEDPRNSAEARNQKSAFLHRGGVVIDVCHHRACTAPHHG